jgi:hypothetical protein
MDDVYKRSHLGKILLIAGLFLLLATLGIGGFLLVNGASRVFATIEEEGTHTFTVPAAGEYTFVRDAELQPNDRGITFASPDESVSFVADSQATWMVIGEQRYAILGTISVPEAGDVTAEISADAYPLTLRYEPMAMTRRVVTIFGILMVFPLALTVIGIVVAIRNTNKRNRFISQQMI